MMSKKGRGDQRMFGWMSPQHKDCFRDFPLLMLIGCELRSSQLRMQETSQSAWMTRCLSDFVGFQSWFILINYPPVSKQNFGVLSPTSAEAAWQPQSISIPPLISNDFYIITFPQVKCKLETASWPDILSFSFMLFDLSRNSVAGGRRKGERGLPTGRTVASAASTDLLLLPIPHGN